MIKQMGCIKGDNRYSVNFVDDRNRLVGFDDRQTCCEYVDWFFAKMSDDDIFNFVNDGDKNDCPDKFPSVNEPDLSNAYFTEEQPLMDYGKFRIEGSPDCNWLVLCNYHNGYYYHGFIYKQDDKVIVSDSL